MSRIGRMHIDIPAGVTVSYDNGEVRVKGPKGELSRTIVDKNIQVEISGSVVNVTRSAETKETKSKHGLYRQLIANMVKGVVEPYTRTLLIAGVGYKASVSGGKLIMNIGFSHPVEYTAPARHHARLPGRDHRHGDRHRQGAGRADGGQHPRQKAGRAVPRLRTPVQRRGCAPQRGPRRPW